MRFIRVIALCTVTATLVALCASGASAGIHPGHCGLFCPHEWEGAISTLAWQDPGSGGPGTNVLAATDGSGAEFDWSVAQDVSRCHGGIVTASCPGGAISAHDAGKPIVTIKNNASSLCMGADASTSWNLTMQACDRKAAPNLATVFVYLPGRSCGQVSDTKFASLAANATSAGGGKITGGSAPGHDLTVTSSPARCTDQLWYFLPS